MKKHAKANMQRTLSLAVGLTFTLSAVQPVYARALREPATDISSSTIVDKIGQWGLTADLRLLKKDLFDGIGIKAGYRYGVDPSFNDGLMTRYDRYYLKFDGSGTTSKDTADLAAAKEKDFGVGLGLLNRLEFQFARQFENTEDALKAKPYFYNNIPLTAEKALNGLKPGDVFSMRSNLGVVVSASFLQGLGANFALDVGAHYLVQGSFQIHALRLPDDKLRLKLVGLRNKEKGAHINVGYEGILKIFKVNRLDRKITSLLQLDPVKISFEKGKNNLFMVDYVVNLKEEASRVAYDQVLDRATDLREVAKTIGHNTSIRELKDALLTDIEPLDKLAREDVAASNEGARVARSFKGSMDSKYRSGSLDLGIRLVNMLSSSEYSENKITSVNGDEEKEYYQLNSYEAKSENSFFFSWLQMKKQTRMNAVFKTDGNFENPQAEDLVISVVRKDKRFRGSEFKTNVIEQIARTLPEVVANKIDYSGWTAQEDEKRNNVAIRYQIVIHPEALDAAPELTQAQIFDRYIAYLEEIGDIAMLRVAAKRQGYAALHDGLDGVSAYRFHMKEEVERIASKLAKALDKKQSGADRLNALMSLRKDRLFLKTGVRFVLELLPQDLQKLKTLIRVDLDVESSDGDSVEFAFGDRPESEIYKRLLTIQNLINDEGLDLRLEAETLKMTLLKAEIVR